MWDSRGIACVEQFQKLQGSAMHSREIGDAEDGFKRGTAGRGRQHEREPERFARPPHPNLPPQAEEGAEKQQLSR